VCKNVCKDGCGKGAKVEGAAQGPAPDCLPTVSEVALTIIHHQCKPLTASRWGNRPLWTIVVHRHSRENDLNLLALGPSGFESPPGHCCVQCARSSPVGTNAP